MSIPDGQEEDDGLASRSTEEVLEDHLRLRVAGRLEDDLRRNYAHDVILLTCNSILQGHDGLRKSAGRLGRQLPNARFELVACQVAHNYAFLLWKATSDRSRVKCGADSFVIRNGKIQMQTVHYELLPGS